MSIADQFARAEVAAQEGDIAGALLILQQALAVAGNCDAYVRYAGMLERAGRFQDAESAFRKAAATDPLCRPALVGLGLLHLRTGRLEEATCAFEMATSLHEDASVLLLLAATLRELYKSGPAERVVTRVLELEPLNDEAHLLLGRLLIARGEGRAAVEHIETALRLDEGHYGDVGYRDLSFALWQAGRLEDAVKAAQRAVTWDEADPFNHDQLARVLEASGDVTGALSSFEAAIARGGQTAWFTCNLAEAYERCGHLDDARARFLEALVLEPDDAETLRRYGMFLGRRGDDPDALNYLRRAAEAGDARASRFVKEWDAADGEETVD